MTQRHSEAGPLAVNTGGVVYRVGYAPDPFAWTPWQYAHDGRFDGRWDDPEGTYRTLYVADRLLGCLLEVLARFRPDLGVQADIDLIVDNDDADERYPSLPAGVLPRSWLHVRRAGKAVLDGEYVDVREAITVATLRQRFGQLAADMHLPDLDTAALKASAPRTLTQAVSGWLYRTIAPPVSGVCFASRFGDALTLWAVFEPPGIDPSGRGSAIDGTIVELTADTPALIEAMQVHHLVWE